MTDQDYIRNTALFEWTFGVLVANFTLQSYRLAAKLMSLVFDIFKLSYGMTLFGPLNENDLKPYNRFFSSRTELVLKLIEDTILLITALFAAKSLLGFSIVGLVVCIVIFTSHVILLILGAIFLVDFGRLPRGISANALLWLSLILVESLSAIMPAILIGQF